MNITMEQKVRNFFDVEYVDTKRYISYLDDDPRLKVCSTGMIIDRAICRLLGVTQFVQTLGVEYEEIDPIYEEYRKKLENLLN